MRASVTRSISDDRVTSLQTEWLKGDLLLSTLASYVQAMDGSMKIMVEFPGKRPVAFDIPGDTEEPRRHRRPRSLRQAEAQD